MKKIKGYENYYIYPDGRVYSTYKKGFMKPVITRSGYLQVKFYQGENYKQHLVHRLVAEYYIPNPNNLPEVDHIDRDRSNNHISNLRWISIKQNRYDRTGAAAAKPIKHIQTGKVYPSMNAAAKVFGHTSAWAKYHTDNKSLFVYV